MSGKNACLDCKEYLFIYFLFHNMLICFTTGHRVQIQEDFKKMGGICRGALFLLFISHTLAAVIESNSITTMDILMKGAKPLKVCGDILLLLYFMNYR